MRNWFYGRYEAHKETTLYQIPLQHELLRYRYETVPILTECKISYIHNLVLGGRMALKGITVDFRVPTPPPNSESEIFDLEK